MGRVPESHFKSAKLDSFVEYLYTLFDVLLRADLCFEVRQCTQTKQWQVFPFGVQHSYLHFDVQLFSALQHHYQFLLAHFLRMVQVNRRDSQTLASSSEGGAFANVADHAASARVVFTRFEYNATLSNIFPRFQLVACFCTMLLGHGMWADKTSDVDYGTSLRRPLCTAKIPTPREILAQHQSAAHAARVATVDALSHCILQFTHIVQKHDEQKRKRRTVRADDECARVRFYLPLVEILHSAAKEADLKRLVAIWKTASDTF